MLICGSVRRAGERLRITAHLIDGATGCYLWSESVDAVTTDVFAAQERVADAIVKKLEPSWVTIGWPSDRDGRRRTSRHTTCTSRAGIT
jgi:Predicted integral membrane protein